MLDIDATRAASLAAHLPLREPRLSTSERSTFQNTWPIPGLPQTESPQNPLVNSWTTLKELPQNPMANSRITPDGIAAE